jgi:hypothetical protein
VAQGEDLEFKSQYLKKNTINKNKLLFIKRHHLSWWLTHIVLATQEAAIRGITVQSLGK